jgi:mannitol/fructose-specific phosphotransferase system IIA component (Ntr-type)
MNALWQILESTAVELELKARHKDEALAEMVGLLNRAGRIREPGELLEALRAREKQVSTGIGAGIAIPHCASPQLDSTVLAFGRKLGGLPFDALDRRPVRLLFLLAGPERQQTAHLRLLSRLARLLRDPRFTDGLLAAQSPEEVVELLRRIEQGEG